MHRVGRVLSFFSSSWDSPNPSPAGKCAPRRVDLHCGTLYMYELCVSMALHYTSELEFLKSLWGLGTEEAEGYRTGPPGYIGWRNSLESIPGPHKRLKIRALCVYNIWLGKNEGDSLTAPLSLPQPRGCLHIFAWVPPSSISSNAGDSFWYKGGRGWLAVSVVAPSMRIAQLADISILYIISVYPDKVAGVFVRKLSQLTPLC
jgi:hypothetical protein